MIKRYARPQMEHFWTEDYKYQTWLEVELAVCEAKQELGKIPLEVLKVIKEKAFIDSQRIAEIETQVKHDVIAFLTFLQEQIGPEASYIHLGLTSSDILDTSLALQMKASANLILQDLATLQAVLKEQAYKYKYAICMGRTHGIHAEPMTLGLKFALWYDDLKRSLERMKQAKEVISVGKMSGPVGTFSSISPEVEALALQKLGLTPANISTQIVQRDRHAQYLLTLSLIAAQIEKMALEIRHLQRTEVGEMEEPFTIGQKGSSAMPHKKNPIGSENLCGLARVVKSNALASLENLALWHERDISHSSAERIIIPDSIILVDYMINRFTGIIQNLVVNEEKMKQNLQASYGLYNSGRVMLALVEKGLRKDEAYNLVQKIALDCWNYKVEFITALLENPTVLKYLSIREIENLFELDYYLKSVDYIYQKVFNIS